VVDPGARVVFDRQVVQAVNDHATGILGCRVAVDIRVFRTLDFDSDHAFLRGIVAHDNVFGLAHVDAGVGGTDADTVLKQYVVGKDRIETVRPVVDVGRLLPFHTYFLEGDLIQEVAC